MLPKKTLDKIKKLYGPAPSDQIAGAIAELVNHHRGAESPSAATEFLSERDIALITYADTLYQPGFEPLKSLHQFCHHRLKDLVSIIHILPFFPYSSDDGFSVIDYRRVNSHHGDWPDIARFVRDFDLCFDLVLNHTSVKSEYFRGFLAGRRQYKDFFIELDEHAETSSVVRPRALPLLHKYSGEKGDMWCWTTFSEDQVDFNFKNPQVLLEMLDILLFYAEQGARMVRLDAIAYLWKEPDSTCVHLPQTHLVIELMRDVLDMAAPGTLLLSETNFPHEENISYFGDGYNQAQVVYNFPLPPLVLYTLTTGNAEHLTRWAETIKPVSEKTTFLNFTASHDGIGVRPAATILNEDEFAELIRVATDNGGEISYKNDHDGNAVAYELNINYFDAINNPNNNFADEQTEIDRFLLSQSIALVFLGVPAIYIHSLIGSRNWTDGPGQTGRPRSINRERINLDLLEQLLIDEGSRRSKVFSRYKRLIELRRREKAFAPTAGQSVLDFGSSFFALVRTDADTEGTVIAIHNVTGKTKGLTIKSEQLQSQFGLSIPESGELADLIGGDSIQAEPTGCYSLTLRPYQFVWLKHTSGYTHKV